MAECSMCIYERSGLRFRLFPGDRASAAQTDWLGEFALQAVEFDCGALPERIGISFCGTLREADPGKGVAGYPPATEPCSSTVTLRPTRAR
ncbi:hypothetical protein GCM10020255_030070 [Rhodococcus baikonurensis]